MPALAKSCWPISAFVLFAALPFIQHNIAIATVRTNSESKSYRAPKQNIWADLNENEVDDVLKFLFSKSDLNLTDAANATGNDNYATLVEVLQPNKTDVLPYLSGTSGPPSRWARVLIAQGADEIAYAANYMVGPLPPNESTEVLPLDFCFNSGTNRVRNPTPNLNDFNMFAASVGANASDITRTTWRHTLGVVSRLAHVENGTVVQWMQFYRQGKRSDAGSLLPQGLYAKIETSTRNPVNWKLLDWYYNGIIYPSSSDLRAALKSPGFQKAPLNLDGNWTDTEDFDSQPPGREIPPPVMVQPKGNRFRLDNEQRFVSWMGFEFFIGTSSATGVALHDISFNGDSVIHELSLQEALAHYAGDDPSQGGLEFLDTFIGIGSKMFELVPGYDCPSYATFLPSTFYIDGSTLINKNSICIFEYTADHALQRHTSAFQATISRNTYLVVRSVSTVGNYDYTIDYIFYLDGSIEVKFRASGFIFGAFWTPSREKAEDGYGYRVQAAVITSMHDHVLNFKADLDIAGSVNTFKRVAIEPVTLEYPWDDERTTPRNTMHLVERTVEREVGLDWPRNSGEMYIVMNENAINSWGEKRGYRIAPGTGMGTPSHLTVLNSTTLEKSANWASSDLWLVNQKDTEPRSASPLNYISPGNPLVDFSKIVNGEDVVQQDLVVYFNLGAHHTPHSGDIPNTLMHASASSVIFTRFNFHDRDPSRRTVQGVKLELGGDDAKAVYFGGQYQGDTHLRQFNLEPDLTEYGAVNTPAKL